MLCDADTSQHTSHFVSTLRTLELPHNRMSDAVITAFFNQQMSVPLRRDLWPWPGAVALLSALGLLLTRRAA